MLSICLATEYQRIYLVVRIYIYHAHCIYCDGLDGHFVY